MKKLDSIKLNLDLLEKTLILKFRPSFLHITSPDEDNDIQVLISTRHFVNKTVHERIQMVINTIKSECPEAFIDRLIVIQAYTPMEMDDVLDYVFDDDNIIEGE